MFEFISDEVMKSEPGAVATGRTSSRIGNENARSLPLPVLTPVHTGEFS